MALEAIGRLRLCERSSLELGKMLRRPRAGGSDIGVLHPPGFQEGAGEGSVPEQCLKIQEASASVNSA